MMVPRKTMEQEFKTQEKELTDDINNLNKKVKRLVVVIQGWIQPMMYQAKYLEKQFNDAQSQLRDIVRLIMGFTITSGFTYLFVFSSTIARSNET
jgi:hypothetical protein